MSPANRKSLANPTHPASPLQPALILAAVLLAAAAPLHAQTTWYVDDVTDPLEDGSVAHPFDTIQEGIDATVDGDTVLVRNGTYTGPGNRAIGLGGRVITVRSQNGPDVCRIDLQSADRAFNVTDGETPDTVIQGFTISNGRTTYLFEGGGGIRISQGSPTIRNCVFDHCGTPSGTGGGAAMLLESNSTFEDCLFSDNREDGSWYGGGFGGAVSVGSSSTVTFRRCLFVRNAVLCWACCGDPVCGGGGGAVGVGSDSTARFFASVFVDNEANLSFYPDEGNPYINGYGGAISGATIEVYQCVFVRNAANASGGAISSSGATIRQSLFVDNAASNNGEGSITGGTVANSIFWNNAPSSVPGSLSYCLININPLFVNPAIDDYRLAAGSPAIDAGDNASTPAGISYDLAGLPRLIDDPATPDTGSGTVPIVDIGPYEYIPPDCNDNGTLDTEDIASGSSRDCNSNVVPDECEPGGAEDCDGNGTADLCELFAGTNLDCNGNLLPDTCDLATGRSQDCNGNTTPDECEPDLLNDCDVNGVPDVCDIAAHPHLDCDVNGLLDECEPGGTTDCNADGVLDRCEVFAGSSADCNGNQLPDTCDLDVGTSRDCNGNETPDECEPAGTTDCNANGVWDACDIEGGTSNDCNSNGVPDECDLVARFTTKLAADDAATGDEFGYSVSVSGDTAVIGAYQDDDGGSASGSAYVFREIGGVWQQIAKLTADDAASDDYFGISVSVSGDTAVIGAYRDDDGGFSSGSAYVFRDVGGTWQQIAKLTADDAASYDYFGISVSVSGDTAVIGAYWDDDGGSTSGSAYVFRDFGGVWQQIAKLTADDAALFDNFGISVSVSGDTAVIGAYEDDDGGSTSGSAYVFRDVGGTWQQIAKLTADDAASYDYFGISVSVSGDTAVIGAYRDDDGGSTSGSAYVFRDFGGVWQQIAKLTADDAASSDRFGYSVSVSGDTAVIGAYQDDDGGSASGSAYVFREIGGVWQQIAKLTADDAASDDGFGVSVSVSGDTAVIGATGDDDGGLDSGSAYAFGMPDSDCNTNGIPDGCDLAAQPHLDCDGNSVLDACEGLFACDPPSAAHCPAADVHCDGIVNGLDVAYIISSGTWGMPTCEAAYPRADCNHDGMVNGLDVAMCVSSSCWGL